MHNRLLSTRFFPHSQNPWMQRWHKIAAYMKYPEELILIGTAVLIGAITAVGAVFFIWALAQISDGMQLLVARFGTVGLLSVMFVAGLVVGFIIDRYAREAKGHGVPEVMEAIVLNGGRIRTRVAAMKVLASSLTIGVGGSAGREGPIVQVGAALGSTLGQWLHFSEEQIRTLVACGAAAGIAATFNAPIAGSLFALEVILGRLSVRHFGSIVLSAVSASIVSRMWLGNQPAFQVPAYSMNNLSEIPVYAVLGVLAALVSVFFIRFLYWAEGTFDDWSVPLPLKTALGMLLTGLTAMLLPNQEVLGPGLHLIGEAIAEDFNLTLGLMALLLVGKLVATTATLGSGNSGGVFAPSLFTGAVLGGIVGTVAQSIWPGVVGNPGAYAIVGMAAVFAGAARAPMTAILIVFEMSGDYKLILPLMMATVMSTLLAEYLFDQSIYTLKLKLKGINWLAGRDSDILQSVSVTEVMARSHLETVPVETPLQTLAEIFAHSHFNGLAVLDADNRLWGVVTVSDVEQALNQEDPFSQHTADIGTTWPHLKIAFPDENIGQVLTRMSAHGLGRLPVVSRQDPYKLLGMVRRKDIIRAYDLALMRRDEIQDRTSRMQALRQQNGMEYVEIFLDPKDNVVGKPLKDVAVRMPDDCVLVSIERNGRVIIPHGDTIFQAQDHITAYTQVQSADKLFHMLHHA